MRRPLHTLYLEQEYRRAVRKVRRKVHESEALDWEDFLTVQIMIEQNEVTRVEAERLLEAVGTFVSRFREDNPDWDSLPRSFIQLITTKAAYIPDGWGVYDAPGANPVTFVLGKYDKKRSVLSGQPDPKLTETETELLQNAQSIVQVYRDWLKARATTLDIVRDDKLFNPYLKSLSKHYERATKVYSLDQDNDKWKSFYKRIRYFAEHLDFQRQVKFIRERWGITSEYPIGIEESIFTLRDYLYRYVFRSSIKVLEYQQLLNEIQVYFFDKIEKLNENDLGLVICAVCFGLEPQDIENEAHLRVIEHLAMQTAQKEPIVSTFIDDWEKFAGVLLALAALVNEFRKIHTDPDDIFSRWDDSTGFEFLDNESHPIAEWVGFAKSFCTSLGIDFNNENDMLETIRIISGKPDAPSIDEATVHVRIDQDTTQKEITGLWNKIKASRIWLTDQETKIRWYQAAQNAMATELARLMIDRELSPKGAIIEYRHKHPDCGLNPDSLSDIERVKKIKYRYQNRQSGTK